MPDDLRRRWATSTATATSTSSSARSARERTIFLNNGAGVFESRRRGLAFALTVAKGGDPPTVNVTVDGGATASTPASRPRACSRRSAPSARTSSSDLEAAVVAALLAAGFAPATLPSGWTGTASCWLPRPASCSRAPRGGGGRASARRWRRPASPSRIPGSSRTTPEHAGDLTTSLDARRHRRRPRPGPRRRQPRAQPAGARPRRADRPRRLRRRGAGARRRLLTSGITTLQELNDADLYDGTPLATATIDVRRLIASGLASLQELVDEQSARRGLRGAGSPFDPRKLASQEYVGRRAVTRLPQPLGGHVAPTASGFEHAQDLEGRATRVGRVRRPERRQPSRDRHRQPRRADPLLPQRRLRQLRRSGRGRLERHGLDPVGRDRGRERRRPPRRDRRPALRDEPRLPEQRRGRLRARLGHRQRRVRHDVDRGRRRRRRRPAGTSSPATACRASSPARSRSSPSATSRRPTSTTT